LQNVVEKSFTVNKKVYIAFVDLLNAFDNINWNIMMKILRMIKTDYRHRRIIRELYKHQKTSIKIKESKREATIRKGMRQGCNLLSLFNIYIEQAINECKEYCTGIKVNGVRIQMLRFADDIAIIAQDEIKRALESLDDILKSNYKIKSNRKKKKKKLWFAAKNFENINIKMGDNALKQVQKFKYLGSIITGDGKNKEDIIQRIKEAKVMFNNKKQLLCSNNLSLEMKKKLTKSCIWSVALYGSETWTLGKMKRRS